MKPMIALAAAALIGAATPALAQVDTPSKELNAERLATANATVAAQAQQQHAMNESQQAQYQLDMAAYREAMRAHSEMQVADAVAYDRKQRAYAQAMFDWRMQVAACNSGNTTACNMPAPDPMRY